MTQPSHERLEQLVEQFLLRRDDDVAVTPEQFAAEHPDAPAGLLDSLRASLEVLGALDLVGEELPERIGAYRVVREIGRGGMGVVYEVERDGAPFALKRLTLAALIQPRAIQRFQREARALQRVQHPGIVGVHEVGAHDGLPHIVMDLVVGRTLADLGPLPWRRAAEVTREVARALACVHDVGLCHRDLKPQNIVLRDDGAPVVLDFGLVHDAADEALTATGDLLGTPRYLAPEQAQGRPADARTDVHALGLVFAELLSGRSVRRGLERSILIASAIRGVTRRQLPRPDGAPAGLLRVLRTATARVPGDRYPDARSFADDLDRLLRGVRVCARPPGAVALLRDQVLFHPRLAGLGGGVLLALAVASLLWLQGERAAAASRAASLAFDDAVLAYLDGDMVWQRHATAATLASQPHHLGAQLLERLVDGAVGVATRAPASDEPLWRGFAARAEQRWPAAREQFAAAVARAPSCPLSRVLLAEAAEQSGQLTEADGELTTAAHLLPDSAALAAALGSLRQRRGDYRAAAVEYGRAVALRPASFSLRLRLARCCERFDAEQALRELAAAEPLLETVDDDTRFEHDNLRAALLDRLGRTAEALPIFEQLEQQRPDDARVVFNLGYVLDRLHRIGEARPRYERALELQPESLNARLCLCWLLATATDESLRDLDAAEQNLLQALRQDRGHGSAALQMVREFCLRTGRVDAIAAELQRLSGDAALPQSQRARLEHTRSYVRNGAPRNDR